MASTRGFGEPLALKPGIPSNRRLAPCFNLRPLFPEANTSFFFTPAGIRKLQEHKDSHQTSDLV